MTIKSMKQLCLSLFLSIAATLAFAQATIAPQPNEHGLGFDPVTTALNGRYSGVVTDALGKLLRVSVLIYFNGERVFVLVGQSDADGGPDSARISMIELALHTLRQYERGKTFVGVEEPLHPSATSLSSAIEALEASWQERVWCYPGRGISKSLARFNHNRSAEERSEMIANARYLSELDLWAFEGYCGGPMLIS